MKAIILAAGEGRRMRPLTLTTPKPLLKIKGRAILEYVFDALPLEITEVVVVVRHLGEQIKNYLGPEFRGRKVFFVEGSDKGTAYSLLAAKPFIGKERFLLIYGDELVNQKDIVNCLKEELGVVVFESRNPQVHGMASLRSDGTIAGVVEKPKESNLKWAVDGIFLLNEKIFDYQSSANEKGEYYLTSLLDQFVKDYRVWAVTSAGFIGDVTTPEDLERVEKIL